MKQALRNCLNKKGKNEFWENEGYQAYKEKYGMHFSDKLATWASKMMKNADGSSHNWSIDDVKGALSSLGYALKGKCTIGDAMYAANMYYADFGNVLKDEVDAVRMAYAIMNDPDGYDGQIFNRWTADIMEKGVCVDWANFM